jgi:uncharacterized protein (DUF4415 family)
MKKVKKAKPTKQKAAKPLKKVAKKAPAAPKAAKSGAAVKKKISISLRVDPFVLDWFRKQGKGYQTLMNAVLKQYVDNQLAGKGKKIVISKAKK